MEPIQTAGALVRREKDVLLILHSGNKPHKKGKYGIMGGKIEDGETVEQGVRRELYEESGLVADDITKIKSYYGIVSNGVTYNLDVYFVTSYHGHPRASPEGTPVWLGLDEVQKLDEDKCMPYLKEIVKLNV